MNSVPINKKFKKVNLRKMKIAKTVKFPVTTYTQYLQNKPKALLFILQASNWSCPQQVAPMLQKSPAISNRVSVTKAGMSFPSSTDCALSIYLRAVWTLTPTFYIFAGFLSILLILFIILCLCMVCICEGEHMYAMAHMGMIGGSICSSLYPLSTGSGLWAQVSLCGKCFAFTHWIIF